jgi:predicted protein tyrosine phosphatase
MEFGMKLKQIVFMDQETARHLDPEDSWAIISIRCPENLVEFKHEWKHKLVLEFHDIDSYRSGYTCFSYEQADEVIDFLEDIVNGDKVDRLVVHCAAGISRSAAVAIFAQKAYAPHLGSMTYAKLHNKLVRSMLEYQLRERNKG